MNSLLNKQADLVILLLIISLYVAIQAMLPHHSFWSNDGGEKLIVVRSLLHSNFKSIELPYDMLGIERAGAFEFAPFYPVHAFDSGGKLISIVPVYFPFLSALPFIFWGHAGLYIIPTFSAVLLLGCLLSLCRQHFGPATSCWAILATGLASPVFFYSLTFWEHLPAASLVLLGITLLSKYAECQGRRAQKYIAAAGLTVSLAAWIRGDVYFLIFGIAAALILLRGYRWMAVPFTLGVAAGLTPFFLINHALYSSFFGPQIPHAAFTQSVSSIAALTDKIAKQWDVITYLLFSYTDSPPLSAALFAFAVGPFLLVAATRTTQHLGSLAVAWAAVLVLISWTVFARLFFLDDPMMSSFNMLGMFSVMPFLPFAFSTVVSFDHARRKPFTTFLLLASLLTVAGYCVGLPSRGGLQWGPRYALPLLPLLILLAMEGFAQLRKAIASPVLRNIYMTCFCLIILAGAGIQVFGVNLLYAKKEATAKNLAAIHAMNPKVIVTDTWWVPEDNADLYSEMPVYTFYNNDRMARLLAKLIQAGEREILLVSPADYRHFIAASPGLSLQEFKRTAHRRVPRFNLNLHAIRLEGTVPNASTRP